MQVFRAKTGLATGAALVFLVLCIAFAAPLVAALVPVEMDALSDRNNLWHIAFFTIKQALLSTALAVSLGIPAAYFTACKRFPGGRLLLSLSAVPLCVPPLLVALGYVMFFGMQGTANRFLSAVFKLNESPITFLYSFWGIIIAQGFYNFPLVMKTCHDAWKKLPVTEAQAATLLGASPFRVFRTITLVQLTPAIISSAMVVFLYCFFSFVIVLLFGGIGTTVLEVEIYQAARSSLNMNKAASLALTETAIAAAITVLYGVAESKSASNRGITFDTNLTEKKNLSGVGQKFAATLLFLVILLFFIAPFFSILQAAFTEKSGGYHAYATKIGLGNMAALFLRRSFWASLGNTIFIGFGTSILSVTAALFYCCTVKTIDPARRSIILRTLPLLPMAVSSVVLGFGITSLVPRGNPLLLCLMQSATCWPFAFRQIIAAMDRIPQNQLDAAKVLSPSRLESVFRVNIPMCKANIVSALGFCFAISCGDTTLPLVMAIPNLDTLSLYTYKLAGSYRFNEACASGLILALLTIPIFVISSRYNKEGKSK